MFQPHQGSSILGRYLLEREIARGGMSSVWIARDGKLQRWVAVKLMAPTWSWSPDLRQRFEREAMAVAQLQSAHIVQVFDYGVEHDCPVIVMELLQGEDLRKRLKREERLPIGTVAKIVAQCAKGLSEAHAAGIIHRDLKPGNVFFARSRHEETVKVLDFGVAKADPQKDFRNQATDSGAILGTPQFMSPEQARARSTIDYRTDLWSLGVIIYQALTGRLPYGGESATDILVKVCTERFAPPSRVAPDLPPAIDAFMAQALAREPEQRFRSAYEMAQAFARIAPVSSSSLHPPANFDIEDEPTHVMDEEPGQAPGVAEMPSAPSMPSMPSVPTHPSNPSMGSGTLGSQYLEPSKPPPNPKKQLALAVLASLVVAAVGVAATIQLWKQPTPEATEIDEPLDLPKAAAPGDDEPAEEPEEAVEDDEAAETEAAPSDSAEPESSAEPSEAEEPDDARVSQPPRPRPVSRPRPRPKPAATPKPPPTSPPPDPYGTRH